MQLNLSGNHLEITPAMRDYVKEKFTRIERHVDNVTTAHVVLTIKHHKHHAEVEIHVRGANLFADAEHEDMYAAIDLVMDKLDRQVRKHKEKNSDHHRAESGKRTTAA